MHHEDSLCLQNVMTSITFCRSPCGIAVMSNGNFVVSDLERHTVGIYSSEGKLVQYLGESPKQSPRRRKESLREFHSPSYVTVDHQDRIIISDSWNHSVKVYCKTGKLLSQLDKLGDSGGEIKYPNGVATDTQGNILIADWGSHTVSLFSSSGEFQKHLVTRSDLIHHPAGIGVSGSKLAITEYSENHSSIRLYEMPTVKLQS